MIPAPRRLLPRPTLPRPPRRFPSSPEYPRIYREPRAAIAARTVNGFTSADVSAVAADLMISLGSAVVATDALVLFIGVNNATTAATYAAPAGWTQILANVTSTKIRLYGFVAYGNVANLTFTRTAGAGAESRGYVCQAFTGVDQTTIIDVAGATNSNTGSNTLAAATYNTVTDNAVEVIGAVNWNGGGAFSASGYTAAMNGAANCQTGMVYSNTALTPAGATGSVTVTDSEAGTLANNILAIMPFSLRPAAGAATGFVQTLLSDYGQDPRMLLLHMEEMI